MAPFLDGIAQLDGVSILTDYCEQFAYQIIENRHVQNSQVIGRKDAYQDTD